MGTHVEVRTALSQFSSSPSRPWGLNLGRQAWPQAPLPTDPFPRAAEMFNFNDSSPSFLCVCAWTRMWRSEGNLQESVYKSQRLNSEPEAWQKTLCLPGNVAGLRLANFKGIMERKTLHGRRKPLLARGRIRFVTKSGVVLHFQCS